MTGENISSDNHTLANYIYESRKRQTMTQKLLKVIMKSMKSSVAAASLWVPSLGNFLKDKP
jgi:hypothetical protein